MTELKSLTTPRRQMPFGGDFDQLFNRAMSRWPFSWPELAPSSEPRALRVFDHVPSVEVKENGKSYNVSVELPGLDEKDVKVLVEDDMLTISGEKKLERTDDKTQYSERSYGSFTRAFTLPADADRNTISARFAKGVLTLEIPKAANPPAQVKQVDIKAG
ncbi:MAG TPA: Hsp20/alpha crystallin family protein [Reyranella sp.]|jgi:HSP20 family protein|nr:Hsp20/alpha crystallin family protein [Reyranella sp.]